MSADEAELIEIVAHALLWGQGSYPSPRAFAAALLTRLRHEGWELRHIEDENLLAAELRGALKMREACLAVLRPLGTYSGTPEMQARLLLRIELTNAVLQIEAASLLEKPLGSVSCLPEPSPDDVG